MFKCHNIKGLKLLTRLRLALKLLAKIKISYATASRFKTSYANWNFLRELKLLTRLRLTLIHLRERKFKHNFHDSLNPNCTCGNDNKETCMSFFLPLFQILWWKTRFFLRNIDATILQRKDNNLTKIYFLVTPTSIKTQAHLSQKPLWIT